MSEDPGEKQLLQLKIDYLAFMEQIHGALGFEPNLMAVLFSLLVEGDYITQDRVMKLTGMNRSTVSETLKKLTDPSSSFLVLMTRRPGERKKLYYCPLSFDEYVKNFYSSASSASEFSEEICREMLARLDALGLETRDARHVRGFFTYLLNVVSFIQDLLEYSRKQLVRFFDEPGYTLNFSEEGFAAMYKEHQEPAAPRLKPVEDDSLLAIKQDYIRNTLEKASPIGRRREIGGISLALILSPDPVTQEDIMEVTGYGRSTVSENLGKIEELNVLNVVKKPGDRKKYYRSTIRLEGYGTQKFQIQRGSYSQIVRMIEGRFLPELEKIPGVASERERLERFFRENVRAYTLIVEYVSFLHDFMLKRTETFELP